MDIQQFGKKLMLKSLSVSTVVASLIACSSPNVYEDLNAATTPAHGKYELGIAFGGGGIRGFMHLGVLKALEEEGIKPDVVSGTSAGSIAAILYAC
ncbi:patatin-like phospholipase family protein [Gayadomonas joobiniege]|uniref:patatin-like phospholipase family protein n=1 Tax=Gayadomonas joobiniege TaxID=1234606 RepID=UPI0003614670|nr:patatin-like phospholipase family protein [Gayadomonas joobiniege]